MVARLRVKVAVVTIERQASRKHPCVGQEDQEISAVAFDVVLKYASVASAALEAFFNLQFIASTMGKQYLFLFHSVCVVCDEPYFKKEVG